MLKQKYPGADGIRDTIVSSIVKQAEEISKKVVSFENKRHNELDRKIDEYSDIQDLWDSDNASPFRLYFLVDNLRCKLSVRAYN